MTEFQRALAVYPSSGWTLEAIGNVYSARQMLNEALDSYSKALTYDPTRTGSYQAVASIYRGWGDPGDTAAHFLALSQEHPDVPWYVGMAAQVYRNMDAVAEATQQYEKLLTFVPRYADAHYYLALLYERGSDARAAMREWNTYLALTAGSQYAPQAEAHREALRRVVITSPADDAQVSGQVAVHGSAAIDNFWYYKIEIQGPVNGEWQVIGDLHYQQVTDGLLETWNTTGLPAGTYRLRLVVVEQTGQFAPPYELTVHL
jgi:tetratricopeptide (TPR) repeat protein